MVLANFDVHNGSKADPAASILRGHHTHFELGIVSPELGSSYLPDTHVEPAAFTGGAQHTSGQAMVARLHRVSLLGKCRIAGMALSRPIADRSSAVGAP